MANSKQQNATTDSVETQVQQMVDEQTEQGFIGIKSDPTPNENYTIAGVTKGLPTPETDPLESTIY